MTKISVKLDLKAKKTVEKTADFEGDVPTGTIEITENGEYDVASYANANVNVEDVPAVVEPVTVNPTTSQQVIEPEEGIDGFNKVTVNAVDNTIDSNIVAENIKKDVTILGVTGELQTFEAEKVYNTYEDYSTGEIKIETVLNHHLETFHYYEYIDDYLEDKGEFYSDYLYYYNGSSFSYVEVEPYHTYTYRGGGDFDPYYSELEEYHLYYQHYYSGSPVTENLGEYTDSHLLMFDASYGNAEHMKEVKTTDGKSISLIVGDSDCPFSEDGDSIEVICDGHKFTITLNDNN